jgi:peroxiredoxin Q/BCP
MSAIQLNQTVPNFNFQATSGIKRELNELKGKQVVLYFYPKDHTPGCTIESKNFRDAYQEFEAANTIILGISRDTLVSHENFKAKHCLPFELISDADSELCKLFDVLKQKSMFGKKYMGIERSTFLIDKNGVLRQAWRKVSVLSHVKEVLAAAKALK